MGEPSQREQAFAEAAEAFRRAEYETVIAGCDLILSAHTETPDEVVRAMYLRARALSGLDRVADAMGAWQTVLEQPSVNDRDPLLSTKVLYSLALAQYHHEHNVTAALQAGQAFSRELSGDHSEGTVWYLARRADWLMTTLVLAGFFREGDELAVALLRADLPEGAGIDRDLIVRNAQLMGMLAALDTGDSERAGALTEDLTGGGEVALRVIEKWIENLENAGGRSLWPQIASGANIKAMTLANLGRPQEALAVLRAARDRFPDEPDEMTRFALQGGEEIAKQIDPTDPG